MVKVMCDNGDDAKFLVECLGKREDMGISQMIAMCLYARSSKSEVDFDKDVRFVTSPDFKVNITHDGEIVSVSMTLPFFNTKNFGLHHIDAFLNNENNKQPDFKVECSPVTKVVGTYGCLSYRVSFIKLSIEKEGDFYLILQGAWNKDFIMCD